MISKWEFVSLWCRFKGYWELAKRAKEIEIALREIYGETITEEWERYYGNRQKRRKLFQVPLAIFHVIDRSDFCIACKKSGMCCAYCEFGNKYGGCLENGSLFREFRRLCVEGVLWDL